MEVSMLIWKDATQSKPKQGDRVLLKIADENNPVVGYWGTGEWEACTVNFEVSCGAFCQGGSAVGNFRSDEVTHYAEIGELPE
jgi:hypothetical protein